MYVQTSSGLAVGGTLVLAESPNDAYTRISSLVAVCASTMHASMTGVVQTDQTEPVARGDCRNGNGLVMCTQAAMGVTT